MSRPAQDHTELLGSTGTKPASDVSSGAAAVPPSQASAFGGIRPRRIPPVRAFALPRAPIGTCLACLAACALWGFWPVGSPESMVAALESTRPSDERDSTSVAQNQSTMLASVDVSAFNAPLWVAPPQAPQPPDTQAEAPPPPPPLKLQLLAITNEDGVWSALVYDPDGDALRVLREGDAAGAYTVVRVSESALDLREGVMESDVSTRGSAATGAKPLRTLALRDAIKAGAP